MEHKHDDIAAALAAVQGVITDPLRTKVGQVRGRRDYKYASIDDLLQQLRPVLSAHGLSLSQVVDFESGSTGPIVFLRTVLRLAGSAEQIEARYPLDWSGDAQQRGSEITYARRYSVESLVGVAATPDDDGHRATQTPETSTGEPRPARRPAPTTKQNQPPTAELTVPDTSGRQGRREQLIGALQSWLASDADLLKQIGRAMKLDNARNASDARLEQLIGRANRCREARELERLLETSEVNACRIAGTVGDRQLFECDIARLDRYIAALEGAIQAMRAAGGAQ